MLTTKFEYTFFEIKNSCEKQRKICVKFMTAVKNIDVANS